MTNKLTNEDIRYLVKMLKIELRKATYTAASDSERHLKIEALDAILKRNDELEVMLTELDDLRDGLAKIVGRRL